MKECAKKIRILASSLICATATLHAADNPPAPSPTDLNSDWNLASGTFSSAEDKALGLKVLTADRDKLIFDTKTARSTDQELHAQVRLRTDVSPTASAIFRVGMKNNSDLGFWLALTA